MEKNVKKILLIAICGGGLLQPLEADNSYTSQETPSFFPVVKAIGLATLLTGSSLGITYCIAYCIQAVANWYSNKRQERLDKLLADLEKKHDQRYADSLPKLKDYSGPIPQPVRHLAKNISSPHVRAACAQFNLKSTRGYIFSGPPGTGKTHLALCLAGELGIPCILQNTTSFLSPYSGAASQSIIKAFNRARKKAKEVPSKTSLLIFDEIDVLGMKRQAATGLSSSGQTDNNNTTTTLMSEIDGLQSKMEDTRVVIIGTTNRPEALDEALTRPGRLDQHIIFSPCYSKLQTGEMLVHYLKQHNIIALPQDLDALSTSLVGKSPAFLKTFVDEAFEDIVYNAAENEPIVISLDRIIKTMHAKLGADDVEIEVDSTSM